jgi:purine-binding chemotaxis protein CheW
MTPTSPPLAARRTVAWEGLARSAARSYGAEEVPADRRELLVLSAGDADYAMPVERVREIVRLSTITHVPRQPDWLVGVVPLRGEVIQVVDLRRRLGLERVPTTRASRIVVIHGDDDGVAGLLVDAVKGVVRVAEGEVLPVQAHDYRSVVEMFRAGDAFVGILDLERVVGQADD